MLDFRPQGSRTPNYFSQREQRRLLVRVMIVGLLVLLLVKAGEPSTWVWVERLVEVVSPPVDTRIPDPRLRAVEDQPVRQVGVVPDDDARRPAPDRVLPSGMPLQKFLDDVRAEWFEVVHDDDFLSTDERFLLGKLFKALQSTDAKELVASSTGKATFVQLLASTESYRGKLVTMTGRVRRVEPIRVEGERREALGVDHYYELIFEPADSTNPVFVYALELPADFPGHDAKQAQRVDEPVEFTGVFVKRLAYVDVKQQTRKAPLLLARTIQWKPKKQASAPAGTGTSTWVVGAAVLVAAGLMVWRRSPRQPLFPPAAQSGRRVRGNFESLRDLELDPETQAALATLDYGPPRLDR